jgi:hypothetical protein
MPKKKTTKIDLYKLHKDEYVAAPRPTLVDVEPATYLAIEGQGAPGGERFQAAVGALYAAAFTIKMTRKFEGGRDYAVAKLEGQWWADGGRAFEQTPPEQWRWRLMIRTPDFVKKAELARAVKTIVGKGKAPLVPEVALESLSEGRCVQMLHVGPYDQERTTIEAMLAFAAAQGYAPQGRHHEIYLSDPRRVPPARLRTILRQPLRKN